MTTQLCMRHHYAVVSGWLLEHLSSSAVLPSWFPTVSRLLVFTHFTAIKPMQSDVSGKNRACVIVSISNVSVSVCIYIPSLSSIICTR